MVTLHILQLLQDNGFGTIDQSLFWELVPYDKEGIGILSRSGSYIKGRRLIQPFDLYCRGTDNLRGADVLEKVWQFISDSGIVCDLPIVPGQSLKVYSNAFIEPVGTLENLGPDEEDRIIFRWSYQITYNKET